MPTEQALIKIRNLLSKCSGYRRWEVFETNVFGLGEPGELPIVVGHTDEPSDAEALVELLNATPELLDEYDHLIFRNARTGVGARVSAKSLTDRDARLRAALAEAL